MSEKFNLRIAFLGLIGVVPKYDREQNNEASFLLVDARKPSNASDGTTIVEHRPFLLFFDRANEPADGLVTEAEEIREYFRSLGLGPDCPPLAHYVEPHLSGDGLGLWRFNGEHLELGGAEADRLTVEGYGPRPASYPATPLETRSWSWVPNTAILTPGSAHVDPDVLQPNPAKGLIVGRVRLTDGLLRTDRLSADLRYGEGYLYDLRPLGKPPNGGHGQAIAGTVIYEKEIAADSVELHLSGFSSGSQSIMLEPAKPGGDVNVVIGNWPTVTDETHNVGKHYELYYNLCSSPPKQRPVPHQLEGSYTMPTAAPAFSAAGAPPPPDFLSCRNPPVCGGQCYGAENHL